MIQRARALQGVSFIPASRLTRPACSAAEKYDRCTRFGMFSTDGEKNVLRIKKACKHFDAQPFAETLESDTDEKGDIKYKITLV